MRSGWQLSDLDFDEQLQGRAQRIRDPVKRLRFLRRAMRLEQPAAVRLEQPAARRRRRIWQLRWIAVGVVLFFASIRTVSDASFLSPGRVAQPAPLHDDFPKVWLVEKTADWELYSNGLRIENRFLTSGRPRVYQAFPRLWRENPHWRWGADPVGIVFHSSESELASFEPEQTGLLKRQGLGLLEHVRRHGLYHFVVDRFGRVQRVVEESTQADHAGQSVWADAEWIYLNLNASFLGIAFEAQTRTEAGQGPINPAQVHAGKVLVEMLRSRYRIPVGNCVTHAQVSVNGHNFRIGYHTDWAEGFPFREVGLPDNYGLPLPSVCLFGFHCDPVFLDSAGAHLRSGLLLAEEQIKREALVRGITPARYRADLNRRYRRISLETISDRAALESRAALEEKQQ